MSEHSDVAEQAVIGAILLEPKRKKNGVYRYEKKKHMIFKKGIN
ncbi:hypothetical protein [Alkalihalobacillus deserti]|nr:hypothetical protein [Alkalihalobacillus deserti]